MRTSFVLMLVASVALHLSLAGWLLFSHPPAKHDIPRDPSPPEAMLLQPPPLPVALPPPAPAPVHLAPARAMVKAAPAITPPETVRAIEQAAAAQVVARKPSVAPETNPNANARPLERDAVLSPTPPPLLNSASGVVFLLDVSGSMYEPFDGTTRLNLAREEMSERLRTLRDGTPFAVVLYAQNSIPSGPLVAASNATREAAVRFMAQDVDCGGGTNLPAGLEAAARLHTGRIVLVTDGDLNATAYLLENKAHEILGPAAQGTDLDVVAIAPRPNVGADRLLEGLAESQGGSFSMPRIDDTLPPHAAKPSR